jgi:hypothetical protein
MTPNSEHGELVARLRCRDEADNYQPIINPDGPEAADLIEFLSLRMREMREALAGIKWKSADRDNMEFTARITCFQMDKIRAAFSQEPSHE